MKIEKQVLSIEQIEYLKELRFEIKDTALCWLKSNSGNYFVAPISLVMHDDYIPTPTLQEILDLLPEEIDNGNMGKSFGYNKIVYMSRYGSGGNDYTFEGENLLEAAYNALCWVAESGYLNKE